MPLDQADAHVNRGAGAGVVFARSRQRARGVRAWFVAFVAGAEAQQMRFEQRGAAPTVGLEPTTARLRALRSTG